MVAIPSDAELAEWQWVADPHADEAVAAIVGPWPAHRHALEAAPLAVSAQAATSDPESAGAWRRIGELNAAMSSWRDNAAVVGWRADSQMDAVVSGAIERYVTAASPLPAWAEPERIARAERLFMDHGALSVTMLFCASLPECYVVPDLAAVLHATGQLEDRAEHRIRTTGAMIFPVMMRGGLTRPDGSGIAQVLKVRLIHATVRNLILRESPEAAVAKLLAANDAEGSGIVPALAAIQGTDTIHRALYVHGWDLKGAAVPNNQEELAYTLLTFSYVFLRSLRRLGIPFTPEEERDYLHAWNVAGHFLGIKRELMVDTMEDAAELFARMQARGRADWARRPSALDPRPRLGAALMDAMKSVIPDGPFKSFPVLLTRRLMEPASVRDLGLDGHVSWLSRTLFRLLMVTTRGLDALGRLFVPGFSLSRLITRLVGYRLTCALLMSQTRELSVPSTLRPGILALIGAWGHDAEAPRWVNAIEDRYTTAGDWTALERPSGAARGG